MTGISKHSNALSDNHIEANEKFHLAVNMSMMILSSFSMFILGMDYESNLS